MMEIYLCLHGLRTPPRTVPEGERPYWLSPQAFIDIIRLVRRYKSEERRICFTFDDGNKSDAAIALPILQDFNCQATFFILSDRIGKVGYVDTADIACLHDKGMVFGSHGAEHVNWTTL